MIRNKYRVFDKKNNYRQSYDGLLRDAEFWATSCAKKIGGYVLAYSEFDGDDNPIRICDFTELCDTKAA